MLFGVCTLLKYIKFLVSIFLLLASLVNVMLSLLNAVKWRTLCVVLFCTNILIHCGS